MEVPDINVDNFFVLYCIEFIFGMDISLSHLICYLIYNLCMTNKDPLIKSMSRKCYEMTLFYDSILKMLHTVFIRFSLHGVMKYSIDNH